MRPPSLAIILFGRLRWEMQLASDGSEAEFDLEAALSALEFIEDEAELCDIAEALAKAIEPEGERAREHVANLTRVVARSRLSSSRFP